MAFFGNADPFGSPYAGILGNPVYGQGILGGATPTAAQPGFSPMPAQPQQQPQGNPFGGFLQGNSNTLMSLGSALLSQPNFGMALANFGQQAPQVIGSDRRRSALNAFLKAKSNKTQLDPATLQLLQSDPDFAEKYALSSMMPQAPIEVAKGGSLYDRASGTWLSPPGASSLPDPPSGYEWSADGKSQHFVTGGPDDPNNPNSKASNQSTDNEKALRGEFIKGSQDFASVRDSYSRIQAAAKEHTGASDLAMVYSYMKMLDPGSAVREGEFANAENAGGVPSQIVSLYNKVIGGGRLPEFMRAQFVQQATRQYQSAMQRQQAFTKTYSGLAQSYGFDPSHITPDLSAGVAPAPIQPPPAVGTIIDGYQFKGGDPGDQNSWVPVTGKATL